MSERLHSETVPAHLRYRGKLDRVESHQVSGWALIEGVAERPVLEIIQDGELFGTVEANQYRADLEQAGIRDGHHAFTFTAPEGLELDPERVRAFFLGTAVALRPPLGAGGAQDAVTTQTNLIRDAVRELKAHSKSRLPALERLAHRALSTMQDSADNANKTLGRIEQRVADLEYGVAGHTIQTFMERYLAEQDRSSNHRLKHFTVIGVLLVLVQLASVAFIAWQYGFAR
ncbi:hypothetical protein SAMN05421644_11157 [Allochromatium warmingii]|uniref:Uncharacterized protein n=1 Tax=Allochromatium warmingii TaxID=61595 RepID=A0A1H3E5C7_ALLWA|nr:hypothetical protein [Allochromatium warmingii]SDX73896.1 hypothetical protein SAMN05421644_11157 [Allochromatium warmingii]